MKKSILILAGIAILFCLNGCKNQKKNEKTAETEKVRNTNIEEKNEVSEVEEIIPENDPIIVYPKSKEMYVFVDVGSNLNYRKNPVDGTKLGKFPNGATLHVTKETRETYTIDGITAPWVYAESYADIEPYGGWVFKGFLTENKKKSVENLLIGEWDSPNYTLKIWANGEIALFRKESEGLSGNWKLTDDNQLCFYNAVIYDEEGETFYWDNLSVNNETFSYSKGDYTSTFTRIK